MAKNAGWISNDNFARTHCNFRARLRKYHLSMRPTHHPSAQTLANYLIGDCSPGAALLVGRHLNECPRCASRLQAMGACGGAASELAFEEPMNPSPGVELTPISGVSGLGERVFRMRVAPGQALPLDMPPSAEEVLLLEGSFTLAGKAYGPGDFISFEGPCAAAPVSDAIRGCVLLLTAADPGS